MRRNRYLQGATHLRLGQARQETRLSESLMKDPACSKRLGNSLTLNRGWQGDQWGKKLRQVMDVSDASPRHVRDRRWKGRVSTGRRPDPEEGCSWVRRDGMGRQLTGTPWGQQVPRHGGHFVFTLPLFSPLDLLFCCCWRPGMMDSKLPHAAGISWSVRHRVAAGRSEPELSSPGHTSPGKAGRDAGRVCKYIPTELFLGISRGLSNGNSPCLEHNFGK